MYSNSDNILTKLNIGDDLSILSINNSMPSWEMINTIKANKLNKLFIDITHCYRPIHAWAKRSTRYLSYWQVSFIE